jgi:hypothetical protein
MSLPLVRKELREHAGGLALLATALVLLLGLVWLGAREGRRERDAIDALRAFVVLGGLFGAAIVNQLLVAREYGGRTQLFLETLPVRRSTVLVTKLALGLLLTLTPLALGVAGCAALAWQVLAVDARLLLILAARALGFGLFAFAVFFAFSFLGRYRIPCLLLAGFALAFVAGASNLEIDRAGPLALVDETFRSERARFPASDLAWSLGLSAFLLAAGLFLGLQREGSVAAMLAEAMSQREKAFVAVILVASVMAMVALEERRVKSPFDLKDAVEVEGGGARVELSPAAARGGRELATLLHGELAALAGQLGARLPPVFLTLRRDLDPFVFERGSVGDADGILVRLRAPAPEHHEALVAWLARETLQQHTRGRSRREPGRWVLDGVGLYWARRHAAGLPLGRSPDLTLRALYGTRAGLSRATLDRWLRFREEVGSDVAEAVGWSGLASLARHAGAERVRGLLRATLGIRPSKDARAVWAAWRSPFPETFARETGLDYDAFVASWVADLQAERAARAAELARVPRVHAELRIEPLSPATRRVSFAVRVEPDPPAGLPIRLRHVRLPLFDDELKPEDVRSEDRLAPLPAESDLPGSWARGARLAWTVGLRSDALGCEVISGWTRQAVP